jgi:putative membrane protein
MENNKMKLSDSLAVQRTILANERTILAYLRTFIGMVGSGAALLKLIDFEWTRPIAFILIFLAPVILVIGLFRYFNTARTMQVIMNSQNE